jgi:hypothetical protein
MISNCIDREKQEKYIPLDHGINPHETSRLLESYLTAPYA